MAGRKRVIQGEVEERLLGALTSGLTIRLACQYAGIAVSTYFEECERNPEFSDRATRARFTHLPKALDQIREAGKVDWKAAAKFVELIAPEDFARQRVELSTAEPLKITLDFGGKGPDQPT